MNNLITELCIVVGGSIIIGAVISAWMVFAVRNILIDGWDIDATFDLLKMKIATLIYRFADQ